VNKDYYILLALSRRLYFHRCLYVRLFVCFRITRKPLNRFPQNSDERWYTGHG